MKKLVYLFLIIFFYNCNNNKKNVIESNNDIVNNDKNNLNNFSDTSNFNLSIDDSEDELSFETMMSSFINEEYVKNKLVIDTTLFNNQYNVKVFKNCLFDSAVNIPSKYNWGELKTNYIAHNIEYIYIISKFNQIVFEGKIEKSNFETSLLFLNSGVLLNPTLKNFIINKDSFSLIFSFSLSIPLTDIGEELTKKVDIPR